LFFAVQSWTHLAIFSSPLDPTSTIRTAGGCAEHDRCATGGAHETLAAFAPVFDRAALLNAKALIILMGSRFAPVLPSSIRARAALSAPTSCRASSLHLHPAADVRCRCCWPKADLLLGGGGLAAPAVDIHCRCSISPPARSICGSPPARSTDRAGWRGSPRWWR